MGSGSPLKGPPQGNILNFGFTRQVFIDEAVFQAFLVIPPNKTAHYEGVGVMLSRSHWANATYRLSQKILLACGAFAN